MFQCCCHRHAESVIGVRWVGGVESGKISWSRHRAAPPPMFQDSSMNVDPTAQFDPLNFTASVVEQQQQQQQQPSAGEAAWASASSSTASSKSGNENYDRTSSKSQSGWKRGFLLRPSSLSRKKIAHLRNTARITPWYDDDERCRVGRGLLLASRLFPPRTSGGGGQASNVDTDENDIIAGLRVALNCVAVWRSKCGGGSGVSLPHAIDATATLASSLYEDYRVTKLYETSTTLNQLRNAYSSAIIRSVNGLADSVRRYAPNDKGMSVMQCCASAGLPSWIVDVRHDASHSALPSLCVCRLAAIESLNFWNRYYWTGQISLVDDLADTAAEILIRYQTVAMTELLAVEGMQRQQHQSQQKHQKQQHQQHHQQQNTEDSYIHEETKAKKAEPIIKVKKDTNEKGGYVNPWSILSDDKPKKKKKRKTEDTKNEEGKMIVDSVVKDVTMTESTIDTPQIEIENGNSEPPAGASSVSATASKPAPPVPMTARDYALEYVKKIPMDVAYTTSLRFLVWGRPTRRKQLSSLLEDGVVTSDKDNKIVDDGPALLTLPLDHHIVSSELTASTLLERESYDLSFERLRIMYDPLLIAIASPYPGFLHALFVHMVDAILTLVGDRGCSEDQTQPMGDVGVDKSDRKVDTIRLGHHIQYLTRWVRYILSRTFHMHFDTSVALWYDHSDVTADEIVQQKEHDAPCESTGVTDMPPLCEQHQRQLPSPLSRGRQAIDLKKRGRKKWTTAQRLYMQSPLEYLYLHKTVGLPLNSVCDRLLLYRQQLGDSFDATALSSKTITNTNSTTLAVVQLHQHIESVIGKKERIVFMGLYDDDEVVGHAAVNDDGSNETLISSDKDKGSPPPLQALPSTGTRTIKPWTLCKGWDACAIGTLPGFPS